MADLVGTGEGNRPPGLSVRPGRGPGASPGRKGRLSPPSVDYSQPTALPPGFTFPFMVGQELKAAREAAGLTQEKLAFKAGVDRSYISLLEHDHKSPTLDTL